MIYIKGKYQRTVMGLFNRKKKKQDQENIQQAKVVNTTDNIANPDTPSTDVNNGLQFKGEVLERVYAKNIVNGTFTLPKHIKAIDSSAFSHLQDLQTVMMHDGVRFIAPFAFHCCHNLTDVIGLENAQTMKTIDGFGYCDNLKNITLPQTLTSIAEGAFKDCKNLTCINIPDNCWFISSHSFAGCENLLQIKIPASVEFIDSYAFAGCKNLTITFLDDDKKYLQDYIKEQESTEAQFDTGLDDEFIQDENDYDESSSQLSDEDKKILYDDLGIKYRNISLAGKDFLWTTGKIIIKPNALAGVKEVITSSQDTLQTIMKSGFKGKITYVDRSNLQTISTDISAINEHRKNLISQAREKYYKQTLIPSGGTFNWIINCDKHNYKCNGYTENVVYDIPTSFDSHITVSDHLQSTSNSSQYAKEYEEFFTSVSFFKKELDNHSIYAPNEYEREYVAYFPYGTRFNKYMLTEIGTALSGLIDLARDLPHSSTSATQLNKIQSAQKKLLNLFITGTNNKIAVTEIMKDITLPTPTHRIREARYKKDWLPYFTEPMFSEYKELEEYRNSQNNNGVTK